MQEKSTVSQNAPTKIVAISLTLLGSLVLSGCAPEPAPRVTKPAVATKSAAPTKTSIPAENPIPSPTGTLAAKGQLDCNSLTSTVNSSKPGFVLAENPSPAEGTYESRALKSGGQSCKWDNSSTGGWVTISMQKISPEDYRDIAANLQAIASTANFNSVNGSQSFLEQQGDSVVAHELNNTYWLTVRSNVLTGQTEFAPLMGAAEKQIVG